MARNVLQSSLLSAGFSIIFQILCRILTFGINAFIVRNVGREVLGIMNVRLLLLESTLLFLSREAINRAALSATSQQQEKCSWPQLVNQMWLTVPIVTALSFPCVYVWLNWLSSVGVEYGEQYRFACYAVAVSCVMELCAEAPVFVTQVFCFVKLRIVFNTLHILVRSIIFLWLVVVDGSGAIRAFAIAQLASALTIIVCHYGFFYVYIRHFNTIRGRAKKEQPLQKSWEKSLYENMDDFPFRHVAEMLPAVMPNNNRRHLNMELQVLTMSFVKQGVLKQILTEGEKYVMSMSPVLSFSEQATYDVVNNLGSLAARFIFRPIEDSSYFYFTQTIARDVELSQQDRSKVLQAGAVLRNLSVAVTSIGLMALAFGQSYSHSVLLLYGGADFVAGGLPESLLQWHCLAICFLAVNGITEGYMFATNTSSDIDKYNYLMAIFSISFLLLSYLLTSIFGPVGFIFANCINMFCRICYSTRFIWNQFKTIEYNPLKGLVPGKMFGVTLLVVGLLCKYSMYNTKSMLHHWGFGCMGVLLCLGVWAVENRELVKLSWRYGRRMKHD